VKYSELPFPQYTLRFLDINPQFSQSIFLLHGLGVNASSWELQFPALTHAGFRIIAPDTRGFGQSTYGGKIHGINDLAYDVAQLIHFLDTKPAYIAGISLGGLISLQTVLDFPELMEKAILINAFAHLRPRKLDQWFYMLVRFIAVHTLGINVQAKYVSQRIFPDPHQEYLRIKFIEQISQSNPKVYRATMRVIAWYDVRNRLCEVKIPTLIITGENDSTVSPANQQFLAQNIKNSRQVIIPNAGHAVTIDQPETINEEIVKFLRE
jgi:3-oxoadipate enol-lactonase